MARVTGIGGVFFKAQDPAALGAWYSEHLGLDVQDWGGVAFRWRDDAPDTAYTIWGPFAADTDYFDPSTKPYVVNLRVDDLDALLQQLRDKGIDVLGGPEDHPQGRFAWILDPEGTKLELWQPDPNDPALTEDR